MGNILDLCSKNDNIVVPDSVIQVLIRSGSKLKNTDFIGTSDPYCMCRVGLLDSQWDEKSNKTHRQSPPILETTNPEWNFATVYHITQTMNDIQTGSQTEEHILLDNLELHIRIMDNDVVSSDELLGEVTIPLVTLLNRTNYAHRYKLTNGTGSIVVMVGDVVKNITMNTLETQLNRNMLPMWLNSFQQYIEKSDDELVYTSTMIQFLAAGLSGDVGLRNWFLKKSHGTDIWKGPEDSNCTTYYSHSDVSNRLKILPSELGTNNSNGTSERTNNLGFQKLNTTLWKELPEGNQCIGLGQTQENHAITRQFLDKILGSNGKWTKEQITSYAKDFFNCKHSFNTGDFKVWTMTVLHKIIFDIDLTWQESVEFSEMQKKILIIIAPSKNIMDNYIVNRALDIKNILAKKALWLERYKQALRTIFPQEISDLTEEQFIMLTSNLMDSLLFAGGQSIPTVLSYCVTLLYSDWLQEKLPDFTLNVNNLYQYVMEVIRFFPPVSGFVYKERSMGNAPSQKIYLNLHMAQCDKKVWGDSAHDFKLRSLREYKDLMLAWANNSVGLNEFKNNSRVCPAKDLSIVMIVEMIKAFIKTTVPSGINGGVEFDKNKWLSNVDSKNIKINNYALTEIVLTRNRTGFDLTNRQIESLWFDGNNTKFDDIDGHTKLFIALVQAIIDPSEKHSSKEVSIILPKQKLKTDYKIGNTGIRLTSHDEDEKGNALLNLLKSSAFYITKHFPFSDKLVWFNSKEDAIVAMRHEFSSHIPPQYNYWDDISSDAATEKMCFYGVGQIYVRNCINITDNMPANSVYEINLEYLSHYETRNNFIRYGNIAYFNKDKQLIGIWSCDKSSLFHPGDDLWEHVKFAFRSTLVTDLTLKHHLANVHLIISNKLMLAARETCEKTHPLRKLLKAHYYRTAAINWGAKEILLPVKQLAHRTWGFTEKGWNNLFEDIFKSWIYKPLPTLLNETNLDCKNDMPFYTDSIKLWNIMRKYVLSYLTSEISSDTNNIVKDKNIIDFWNHFNNDFNYGLGELTFDNLIDHITNSIWWCTAGHEMVGSIVEYLVHPNGLMPKICPDKTIADVQTFAQALIIISLTGLRQPGLMNDWEHLFDDPKHARVFQQELFNLSQEIDSLNLKRIVPYNVMNPKILESSVSI